MKLRRVLCLVVLAGLAACAGAPSRPTPGAAPGDELEPRPGAGSAPGSPQPPAASPLAMEVVARARGLVGVSYRVGGADPRGGFDCSGLVHFVFAESGVRLPRTAESQQQAVMRIERDALAPGDLVFFRLPQPHVGIYAGDGEFVHAPGPGRGVEIGRLGEPWFVLGFAGAGRVVAAGSGAGAAPP